MGEVERTGNSELVKEMIQPIYNCKGWLKFLGVLSIIAGALQVLSIIGILWAWLPIWMGVIQFQAAARAEDAFIRGDKALAIEALNKIKLFFVIMAITTLVALIAAAVFVIDALVVGISMSGMPGMPDFQ